jgi:hypothetical protein
MEEQLITLETAVLAKEKGFDSSTVNMCWVKSGNESYNGKRMSRNSIPYIAEGAALILQPTQALLQKWLREKHNINISITTKLNIKKWDFIPYDLKMNGREYVKYYYFYYKNLKDRKFDSYEDALEEGLVEALNLI